MMKIWIPVLLILIPCCADEAKMGPRPVLLPHEELSSWKPKGAHETYRKKDLFEYINGGADIYHEFGFNAVWVQTYENSQEERINLDIYEMEDSCAAYGIYTFKRDRDGVAKDLGQGGTKEGYYLNFWKGNLLVTLTGLDDSQSIGQGLEAIAGAVDKRIKTLGKVPEIMTVLPEKKQLKGSKKYFKGFLGFFNCYPFFTRDVFHFDEGAACEYEDHKEVIVLRFFDEPSFGKRFDEVKRAFKNSTKYTGFQLTNSGFLVEGSDKKKISVDRTLSSLIITIQ